jgi:hypothetical protein
MSRHTLAFVFLSVCFHSAKPPLSPSFYSHSLVSDIRSVQGGCPNRASEIGPKSRCPVTRAGSNGRCNTIWYKAVFLKVVFMKPGKRFGLSAEQKIDVWRRWKVGQTLHEIGRAFGKEHSSIRCLVSRHGGIAPAVRRRALLAGWLPVRRCVRWPHVWSERYRP